MEFTWPTIKPGAPTGALALEPDRDGNWWLALMFQGGLMKFDVHTQTFRHYPLPPNLDSDTGHKIIELMKTINEVEKTTLIFSTHDTHIMEHARRVVTLRDGLVTGVESRE